MAKLSADAAFIHDDCAIDGVTFGALVEIGKGARLRDSHFHDYSYCDQFAL